MSENIIEASWIALVDSFEYKLFKDEAENSAEPPERPSHEPRGDSRRFMSARR